MHSCDSNVDSEWVNMCHWTVLLININNFDIRTPILQWQAKNLHAPTQPPYLILVTMSEKKNFVPSGRDLIGVGAEIRLTFLFLSYFTKNYYLQNCL